jgi:hypothetical protein
MRKNTAVLLPGERRAKRLRGQPKRSRVAKVKKMNMSERRKPR